MRVTDDFLQQLYLPAHLMMKDACSVEGCRSPLTYAVFWTGKFPLESEYDLVYDLRCSCDFGTHLLEAARHALYGEYDFILDLRTQELLDFSLDKDIKDQLVLEGFFTGYLAPKLLKVGAS